MHAQVVWRSGLEGLGALVQMVEPEQQERQRQEQQPAAEPIDVSDTRAALRGQPTAHRADADADRGRNQERPVPARGLDDGGAGPCADNRRQA